jgi:hypothetical protein
VPPPLPMFSSSSLYTERPSTVFRAKLHALEEHLYENCTYSSLRRPSGSLTFRSHRPFAACLSLPLLDLDGIVSKPQKTGPSMHHAPCLVVALAFAAEGREEKMSSISSEVREKGPVTQ